MRIAKIFHDCTRRVLEFGSLMVTHWNRNLTNSFQPSWRPVYRALGSSSSCCICLKLSSVFLLLCVALSRRLWRRPRLSGGRAAQRYCSCDCTCQGLGGKVFQDGDCLATNGRGRGIPSDNFNPRRQFAYLCHLFSVFRNGYPEAVRRSSHWLELNTQLTSWRKKTVDKCTAENVCIRFCSDQLVQLALLIEFLIKVAY